MHMAKKRSLPRQSAGSFFPTLVCLFPNAKFFLGNDGAVTANVLLDKVIKQATAFTYKHFKGSCSAIILVI